MLSPPITLPTAVWEALPGAGRRVPAPAGLYVAGRLLVGEERLADGLAQRRSVVGVVRLLDDAGERFGQFLARRADTEDPLGRPPSQGDRRVGGLLLGARRHGDTVGARGRGDVRGDLADHLCDVRGRVFASPPGSP
ncbi:hypothetical protein AQI88_29335 [Streptomyces cellostaticus]|uniref:Uncharacterized protein n=2 Tax=Streptomyces cellostaticus TaxID=67285 RepID=A0A101NGU0_9ACTN|nr:hypothetical protein AQI88_29335 [Streptomyces cellostaticus]GHI04687.1 hypothetical protein Scel_30080 [Streptomyces cellostaticus]